MKFINELNQLISSNESVYARQLRELIKQAHAADVRYRTTMKILEVDEYPHEESDLHLLVAHGAERIREQHHAALGDYMAQLVSRIDSDN